MFIFDLDQKVSFEDYSLGFNFHSECSDLRVTLFVGKKCYWLDCSDYIDLALFRCELPRLDC